jgi:hypothetical protein
VKALSYSTPWDKAINFHGKRAENRNRWLPHRHLIAQAERMVGEDHAIQASGTYDKEGAEYIAERTGHLYTRRGVTHKVITSVAKITGLIYPGDPCPEGQEDWWFGGFAMLLDDVRVLPEPVPMKGGLGWLTVEEPVLGLVLAQLERL